jgi:hypothetical protein
MTFSCKRSGGTRRLYVLGALPPGGDTNPVFGFGIPPAVATKHCHTLRRTTIGYLWFGKGGSEMQVAAHLGGLIGYRVSFPFDDINRNDLSALGNTLSRILVRGLGSVET